MGLVAVVAFGGLKMAAAVVCSQMLHRLFPPLGDAKTLSSSFSKSGGFRLWCKPLRFRHGWRVCSSVVAASAGFSNSNQVAFLSLVLPPRRS